MTIRCPSLPGSSVPSRRPTPAIVGGVSGEPRQRQVSREPGGDELTESARERVDPLDSLG